VGTLRGRLIDIEGRAAFLISRHSAGHKMPPHKVNYAAMAVGLMQLGAKACLATAAVGSLRAEWGPGTFVVCSDFIDLTGRNLTLYNERVVHRDFTAPFAERARQALLDASTDLAKKAESKGVYVCGNGPRYETPHEIELYANMGDVIGMTAASEAILMREAEIDYACLAIVTNLAAGISATPLNHQEVVEEMERSGEIAVEVLKRAVVKLA
jgi:5'-methylthioadenosine phosphorylase